MSHSTYGDGNIPRAGDLIKFGTQSKEYLITSVSEDPPDMKVISGTVEFENYSLPLMTLIARHGETV